MRPEVPSSLGRCDLVVREAGKIYLLEVKLVGDEKHVRSALKRALEQIREHGYADQYRDEGKQILLLGLVFNKAERNLVALKIEPV